MEYINITNPPDNKVSWRRRNHVHLYVPAMSQVSLKWNTQRCLDGTSPSQDVSVVRLHDVLLERRDDVSRGPNNNVLSVRLCDLSNKAQMKHSTISQLSGTSPRYLSSVVHHQDVSVVGFLYVPLVRLYHVSCKSRMKHPISLLWYISTTSRSYVVAMPY